MPALLPAQQQAGKFMAYGPETRFLSGLNGRVYQSNSGFLWICSGNGLIRFDGKRYSIFTANHADPNSITDNIVSDVAEDKNGALWIAGFSKGVSRYNQHTGRFTKYPVLCNDNNPVFGINRIVNDAEKNLWFATAGRGIARYDFEKDSFHFFYPEPQRTKDGTVRGDNFITDIEQDPIHKNLLWIGSFHGLFLFDKVTGGFTRYASISNNPLADILVNDIEIQVGGKMWVATWGSGMQSFDMNERKFQKKNIAPFSPVVYDVKLVNDSSLYAACLGKGLFLYNIKNNTATNITPPGVSGSELTTDIQRVSVTPAAGVFAAGKYYVYQQHPFYTRLRKNIVFPGMDNTSSPVNAVLWDAQRRQYRVCTYDKLYSISADKKTILSYDIDAGKTEDKLLLNMVQDTLHRIWVLYRNRGLFVWSDKKNRFTTATFLPLADTLQRSTRSIGTDASGNLWMFAGDSMYCYDVIHNSIKSMALQWDAGYSGRRSIIGPQLIGSPENEMWLLSQQGIFIFNKNGFVKHIHKTGNNANSLASTFVMLGAFNVPSHTFWLSSGDGLQVMDDHKHTILSTHRLNQGLPSSTIRGIAADEQGRVWVAGLAGVGHFNPNIKIWRNFNRMDGLENDYLDAGVFALNNNMIAIPQNNGMALYPDSVFLVRNKAHLRITSILVNNEEYTDTLLPEFVKELKLAYDKNNVIIEYAAMDWVYPFKTNYVYRIEGVKGLNTWMPNEEASINLAGLQPGNYTLYVKALNNGGEWSNEVMLPIQIYPPFYKTWWFLLLLITAVAAAAYLLFRYRITQLKKLQTMRNNISRNLHDDIGASLSNIGILNELARRNVDANGNKAKELLNRAAEDIQHISENLGDIVWNINPQFDNIDNLFIRMKRYAADMTEGKNMQCTFEMPEHSNVDFSMEKRRNFYLLYKEAVNNMVKHSQASRAFISIVLNATTLQLTVQDNGKGFSEAMIQEGNGLHNMKQRAAQLHGTLKVISAAGNGTILLFTMPV